jgi:sugar lactone lactonase YvrE
VTLGSSLTVAGATTMNGATVNGTVTVTGSTALQSSLGVTGAATLGSTLAVAGATTLTGPSQINNSLGVTGAATLGSVTVSGASQMNSTLAVNGAATLGGAMTVAGATQVNNTLGVTGSATIGGAMVIAGATQVNNTLGVQGNSTLAGELNVAGIAQLNNALNVTGTTVLSGTLGVIGASTFDDAVDIEGATTLNGVTTVNDNMIVNGKVTYTTANVYGESIQFNLSSVAPIDSYSVGTTESAPVLFALVGSDDNVEWFVIDQPTSIVYSSNVCTRSVTASYMYYRLVLSKISGTSVSVNYVGLSYQGTPLFTASNLSPPTDVVTTYSTVTAVTPGDQPNIGGLKSSTSDVYGNLYVMTSRTGIIQVTPNGASSSIAYYGDSWGGGLACDGTDYVYIADSNNRRIIQYDIDTGAPAFFATPNGVSSITVDSDGYVYFDNGGNYPPSNTIITKLDPSTGVMTTLYTISAFTSIAAGIAVDSSGNVYYTDTTANTIIRVTQGVATTIAGTGSAGSANGVGTAASFSFKPVSYGNNNNIAYYNGSLYIADTYNNRIRKLNLSTMAVTTVAGGSQSGFVNGNGTSALFLNPVGISLDSNGNIYVCDQNDSSGVGGYIVRMIDSVDSNTITNGGLSVTCNLSFASDSNMTVRNTNSVNLLVNSGLTSTIAKVGWSGSAGQQAYISNRYPSGIAGSSAPTISIITDSQITGSFTVNTQSAINSTLAVSGATTLGSSIAVVGASTLGSTLAVTGASTLDSTLAVTGASTLSSSLTVAGASQLNNSLAVSGAASLNSTLAVQGNSTFQNNVTVHGNLTVLGGQTSVNTVSMEVKDNAILIADNNTADVLESGLQIQYKPVGASAPLYAGIKRIPVTGQFALFKDATSKISETEPAGQIIQTQQTVYGEWSQLHLATASPITSYQFVARIEGGFEVRSAIEWYVVGSNDESTWTIVDHQTNNSGWNTYTLPAACPSYSYYRFIFTHLNIHILNIRQIILYNNGISLFSSANNYTVAGEYLNILQQNGITVCTMTPSYGFINQLNSNGIISEIPPFPGVYPAFLPTTDGNYVATSGFVVAQVGGSFTYNSNYVATSGTSTVVTVTTITTTTDIYAGIIADSFACASDMNLKKNIVNLDGALDKLDNIRGVYHDWIDENQSKDRQIGVIAQEVEAIYPELVTKGENGYLSVNYPKLTAVLIQAVKELKAIVCGSGHTQTASKKRKQMSSETRKLK